MVCDAQAGAAQPAAGGGAPDSGLGNEEEIARLSEQRGRAARAGGLAGLGRAVEEAAADVQALDRRGEEDRAGGRVGIGGEAEDRRAEAGRGVDHRTAVLDEGELVVGVDLPELQAQPAAEKDLFVPELVEGGEAGRIDVGEALEVADEILRAVPAVLGLEVDEESAALESEERLRFEREADLQKVPEGLLAGADAAAEVARQVAENERFEAHSAACASQGRRPSRSPPGMRVAVGLSEAPPPAVPCGPPNRRPWHRRPSARGALRRRRESRRAGSRAEGRCCADRFASVARRIPASGPQESGTRADYSPVSRLERSPVTSPPESSGRPRVRPEVVRSRSPPLSGSRRPGGRRARRSGRRRRRARRGCRRPRSRRRRGRGSGRRGGRWRSGAR